MLFGSFMGIVAFTMLGFFVVAALASIIHSMIAGLFCLGIDLFVKAMK